MSSTTPATDLLDIAGLCLTFHTPGGDVQALRGVDLKLGRGRIMGVVGESGSGKTMTGRAIMSLVPKNAKVSGRILFEGTDLLAQPEERLRQLRGKRIAMIFQDPSAALNPVFTIGQQLSLVLQRHQVVPRRFLKVRSVELLGEVGLPSPPRLLNAYPHELSGGMQQRVMIAMAISARPVLLIADEPTTSLDVTVQMQILQLLQQLRDAHNLTVLLITHNMAVVAQACQDVAVLYAGRTVEQGPAATVLAKPSHPYTRALLGAQPSMHRRGEALNVIPGSVPSGTEPITGCAFVPRCPRAMPICRESSPILTSVGDVDDVDVACFLYGPVSIRD